LKVIKRTSKPDRPHKKRVVGWKTRHRGGGWRIKGRDLLSSGQAARVLSTKRKELAILRLGKTLRKRKRKDNKTAN